MFLICHYESYITFLLTHLYISYYLYNLLKIGSGLVLMYLFMQDDFFLLETSMKAVSAARKI